MLAAELDHDPRENASQLAREVDDSPHDDIGPLRNPQPFLPLNLRILVVIAAILASSICHAQTPRDFAVDLKVAVSASVPRITLQWTQRQQSAITGQQMYRRLKGAVAWELL